MILHVIARFRIVYMPSLDHIFSYPYNDNSFLSKKDNYFSENDLCDIKTHFSRNIK